MNAPSGPIGELVGAPFDKVEEPVVYDEQQDVVGFFPMTGSSFFWRLGRDVAGRRLHTVEAGDCRDLIVGEVLTQVTDRWGVDGLEELTFSAVACLLRESDGYAGHPAAPADWAKRLRAFADAIDVNVQEALAEEPAT